MQGRGSSGSRGSTCWGEGGARLNANLHNVLVCFGVTSKVQGSGFSGKWEILLGGAVGVVWGFPLGKFFRGVVVRLGWSGVSASELLDRFERGWKMKTGTVCGWGAAPNS